MGSTISYNKIALVQWYREGQAIYGKAGFEAAAKNFVEEDLKAGSLLGKNVAVTGGNQGIGYEAALGCAKLGATVHLLCRNAERAAGAAEKLTAEIAKVFPDVAASSRVQVHQLDVGELQQVRTFAETFIKQLNESGAKLDVLINNAGCMPEKYTKTSEGNEAITACTLGGSMLLTGLLFPVFTKGSHVINVSSGGMYSVQPRPEDLNFQLVKEKDYDGTMFYAYNKRHQMLLTEIMAEKFTEKTGIRFSSMHPGWADTEALRASMKDFYAKNKDTLRSPAQGADTIVFLAASQRKDIIEQSGEFWFDRAVARKDMPMGGTSADADAKSKLWTAVSEYVGPIPPFSA